MPRAPRSFRPGRVYHLISRFVDREWFIRSEDERLHYLVLLGRALRQSDWRCISYGVMSNHIHSEVIAGTQALDSWIRRVHSPFADWMNRTYDRIGNMFVRGPKSIEVPPERVGAVIAYIHNNPVRAGVVAAPAASPWTSHRAYLGLERAPRWLHVDDGLARAGFANRDAFDQWVRTHPSEREVMEAVAQETRDDDDEPATRTPEPGLIVQLTAAEMGIPVAQLCSRRRSREETLGRRVVAYCAARAGVPGARIAAALGVSQQAVSLAHRRESEPAVRLLGARILQRLATP